MGLDMSKPLGVGIIGAGTIFAARSGTGQISQTESVAHGV